MTYKDELIKAMKMLEANEKVIFLGQEAMNFYGTMKNINPKKIIEMPIMEDAQLGISTGLSLAGYIPISMYPRMDFFLLAFNQLINHLDKIKEMSDGIFNPKVIIRVAVGKRKPLDPGIQHTQDFSDMLEGNLKNIRLIKLRDKNKIKDAYKLALDSDISTILVEYLERYDDD